MNTKLFVILFSIAAVSAGFGGSEDRLIKKYAMMKVYESCFGQEVVDEVKKEMKEACLKCSGGIEHHGAPLAHPQEPLTSPPPHHPPAPPRPVVAPATDEAVPAPEHPTTPPTMLPPHPTLRSPTQMLHNDRLQAILSMRPLTGGVANRPQYTFPHQTQSQDQKQYFLSNLAQSLGNALYEFGNNGYGVSQQQPSPVYRNPYYGGATGVNAGNPYFQGLGNLGGLFSQAQHAAPVFPQSPYFPSFYSPNMRNSRELDLKKHLDAMASRLEGGRKIRNITCVMQELGYLNEKLEPNFSGIADRIGRLPVPDELKTDMVEGVEFCRKFSMCLPETRKEKFQLSHEFSKPMSFFRCYKQKKLEACIMKDVRERYSMARGVDDEDDSGSSSSEEEEEEEHTLRRSMSSKKRSGGRRGRTLVKQDDPTLEGAVFDFLYGAGDGSDLLADMPF